MSGFPVRQFGKFLPAEVSYVFYHDLRIEFFTCFSHAADVKYSGKNPCHQQDLALVSDIPLVTRIPDLLQQGQQAGEETVDHL